MKQFLLIITLVSCFTGLFIACSSDEGSTEFDNGSAYIPIKEGSWYEYKLDSIIYNDIDNSEVEKSWLLRIEIGETITNSQGVEVVKLNRYLKEPNSNSDYSFDKVWFARIVNGRLETFEENLHFVKFLLPVTEGKTWQGNQFIQPSGNDNPNQSTAFYENWDYVFTNLRQDVTVQGSTYKDVVEVEQVNKPGGPGAINHLVASEWFAKDIGLIKKRMEIVVENCGADNCSDKSKPVLERNRLRKGFILNQELIDYNIVD